MKHPELHRHLLAPLALVVALAGTSCGAVDFDVTSTVPETVLAGDPTTCTLNKLLERAPVNPFVLEVDLERETKARDTGPADRVELKSMSLAITPTRQPAGDVDDFDFLLSLEVFVESARAGSPLPRVKVAELTSVPRGAAQIAVNAVPGVDLLPYINEGARLTSSARGSTPCDDTSLAGSVVVTLMF